MDALVTNTPVFFQSSSAVTHLDGSIVLNNIQLVNVGTAVGIVGGITVLAGGTKTIDTWVQGNVYTGTNPQPTYTAGFVNSVPKSGSLLDYSGRIYGRGRPTYSSYALSQIASVKDYGAKGDGQTDDTEALQAVLDNVSTVTYYHDELDVNVVASSMLTARLSFSMLGPTSSPLRSRFLQEHEFMGRLGLSSWAAVLPSRI
jgi:glucan 1,3-beta-glucosidase